MPLSEFSDQLHAEKYRAPGESFRESMCRIAAALKDSDEHFHAFKEILENQRFLPAGRIQAAMGSPRRITAYNCAVAPTIADSFTDGSNSIMAVATKAAQTMRMGCGIGYDFSTLRPRGAQIKTLGSRSSGAVSFMEIFDAVCRATMSAGHRRGAQMGCLRVDHPDIEEFIRAKQNQYKLTGFNISVAITDEFMSALETGKPFALRWGGQEHEQIDARALWEEIMRSTWDWAEPGVMFIDTINNMNNLWYCETIAATNPCGEVPLPPNGTCLLGSFNLVKYVSPNRMFNYKQLHQDIIEVIRAMDNVVDRTIYPLEAQELEARRKRRMGIGVTGLANALEILGFSYGSPVFLEMTRNILSFLRDRCYTESALLAMEKGPFPLFDKDKYLAGKFTERLPPAVRDLIAAHGIRNSHLLSIAPTGTISLCANNISSGIEPPFSLETIRKIRDFDTTREVLVHDYTYAEFGIRGKTATECTTNEHLDVLSMVQFHVDAAVSKTINVDPKTPWSDFESIYTKAWECGCKGITTYNPAGKREGILTEAPKPIACYVDPTTGAKSCDE